MLRFAIVLLTFWLGGSAVAWGQSVKELRNSGKRHLLAGRYAEAVTDFTQGLSQSPDHLELLSMRAEALRGAGKPAEAVQDMTRYLSLNPNQAGAYAFRAELFGDMRAYEQMRADCDTLLLLQPDHYAHLANRGIAKAHLQDSTGSLADLNRALELAPAAAKADVLFNRGTAHQVFKHHQAAWQDFNASLALRPKDALAYYKRGQSALALHRYSDALRDAEAALRLAPTDADAAALRQEVMARQTQSAATGK